jgi:chromate reductase, NAD(P)H dehydrogenase (quinone)
MQTITLISATNRLESNTVKITRYYELELKSRGIETTLLSLSDLPVSFLTSDMYGKRSPEFQAIIDAKIEQQTRFIFISPEYNGSFAGILKVFLDAIHPKLWMDNKACLVGVASGRAGNLRGMEHLTNILNYLKVNVYHNKLPISMVDKLVDANGNLVDEATQKAIQNQLDGFLKF